jgi:hypothetical protein
MAVLNYLEKCCDAAVWLRLEQGWNVKEIAYLRAATFIGAGPDNVEFRCQVLAKLCAI